MPRTGWTVSASIPASVAFGAAENLKTILFVVTLVLGGLVAAATLTLMFVLRGRERAQRADAERLRSLLEAAPDATLIVDEGGVIVRANAQAVRLFGYQREELVGRPIEMLVPAQAGAAHRDHRAGFFADAAARAMGEGMELFAQRADGRELPVEISLSPLQTEQGTLVSAAVRDISDRKEAERELIASQARLQAMFDHIPGALSLRDLRGRYLHVNEYVAKALGQSPEELVGHDPREHQRDASAADQIRIDDEHMLRTGKPTTREVSVTEADGATHDYLVIKYPVADGDGRVTAFGSFSLDITGRKRVEDANRRLAAIIEATDDAVIAKKLDGTMTEWNPGATRLYGYTAEETVGQPVTMLVPFERLGEEEELLRRVKTGEPIEQHETIRVRKDGQRVYVSLTISPLRDRNGTVIGAATIARDISERKRFEGQLQYLADHDSLTGLFNRRRFEEELRRELSRANRYQSTGAVLAIDLDHFKYVNDSLGHSAGDELITQVGAIFRRRVRGTDVLARIGGDEFAVLLPGANHEQATLVARSLLEALRRESVLDMRGGSIGVTASIGIALFQKVDDLTADDLMVEADIAMYDAKDAGRNRVAVYAPEEGRQRRMQARLGWAERIRHALREDRFVLHAQPIMSLTDDSTPRHELLLRMLDDNDDLVPPAVFLYIAERTGLIEEIDKWVLSHAIRLLAREQQGGRDISLEVNLSGKSITDPEVPELISRELGSAGADPRGLCLEVTETTAIVNIDRAKQFARSLSELGCEFALDDFGAGFASFYYLKHLRFDYLKIDGEFIKDIASNPTDQLVVRSLVQIAQGLGKRTIAEFVSDQEGLELLRRYGVDYAQGFYVGRPSAIPETGLNQHPVLARD